MFICRINRLVAVWKTRVKKAKKYKNGQGKKKSTLLIPVQKQQNVFGIFFILVKGERGRVRHIDWTPACSSAAVSKHGGPRPLNQSLPVTAERDFFTLAQHEERSSLTHSLQFIQRLLKICWFLILKPWMCFFCGLTGLDSVFWWVMLKWDKNQFEVTSGVKLSRLNVLCWPLVNVEAASSVCFSIHVSDTETFWVFQTEHDADNVLRMNEEWPSLSSRACTGCTVSSRRTQCWACVWTSRKVCVGSLEIKHLLLSALMVSDHHGVWTN